jgi:hypothetical protein
MEFVVDSSFRVERPKRRQLVIISHSKMDDMGDSLQYDPPRPTKRRLPYGWARQHSQRARRVEKTLEVGSSFKDIAVGNVTVEFRDIPGI